MDYTRNPKDSMRSTWRQDRSGWRYPHYVLDFLGLYPTDLDKAVPVFEKSEKIPYLTERSCHLWILAHALWPMALQYLYVTYTGHSLNRVATFLLYTIAFRANAIHEINILRRLGHQYGFLDGDKHERDQIPDVGVQKALSSTILTTSLRPLFTVLLSNRPGQLPSLSWWLPVELGLYTVILDLWFYLYHRSCHEFDGLWKYHRTHHLTKHPNPMLSAYADTEQEILEIVVVPLLTFGTLKLMGLPMGFHDWWICHQYIVFTEVFGHSGLRLFAVPASTSSWLLQLFNCELVLEDHDLHHRNGWRKSHNYGKQTRLWDRLFGTCHERIESDKSNIDLSQQISMPLL